MATVPSARIKIAGAAQLVLGRADSGNVNIVVLVGMFWLICLAYREMRAVFDVLSTKPRQSPSVIIDEFAAMKKSYGVNLLIN